jgi:hypothetical protein
VELQALEIREAAVCAVKQIAYPSWPNNDHQRAARDNPVTLLKYDHDTGML